MTCAEIDELAGAIALNAVPEEEWAEVQEHLRTCTAGHPKVRQLMEVANLLLVAAPPMEPSAALRSRILAAARADLESTTERGPAPASITPLPAATAPPAPATPVAEPPRNVTPLRRSGQRWWQQPAWYAAAAALVLAVGLGAWNFTLQRDLDDRDSQLSAQARALTDVAGGRVVAFAATQPGSDMRGVVVRPTNGPATLVLQGLEAPQDKTFQVWALEGNRPVSLGVFTPDASGFKVVTLDHDLHNVDAVAITLEPSPRGSPAPTSAPILVAPVRDQT